MEADKESCFALMASNTLIAANGARAMQIAKIVRTGLHLATTMAKKSGTRSGRRETFLGWLEFIGFNYTTDPSERTRLVKFYLDTLPLLEGITQKKLSDEAIINLHKDQGDFAAKHVQRIANELVDALNRLNMLDVGSAQRILDELEDENPNASELERDWRKDASRYIGKCSTDPIRNFGHICGSTRASNNTSSGLHARHFKHAGKDNN